MISLKLFKASVIVVLALSASTIIDVSLVCVFSKLNVIFMIHIYKN